VRLKASAYERGFDVCTETDGSSLECKSFWPGLAGCINIRLVSPLRPTVLCKSIATVFSSVTSSFSKSRIRISASKPALTTKLLHYFLHSFRQQPLPSKLANQSYGI
jgi:hypothetical protein